MLDIVSNQMPPRKEIIATLLALDGMDESEATKLTVPVSISQKIPTEKRLCSKLTNLVLPAYDGVRQILDDLSGQNKINSSQLGRQIKRMWEDIADKPVSQSDIFRTLVDQINVRSGRRYHDSCELLIAYYVQRCDVFAIPE